MFALWLIGGPVEQYLGRARFLGLYLVAGLAGSAGALLRAPTRAHRRRIGSDLRDPRRPAHPRVAGDRKLGGQAMTLIVINLAFSFTFAGTSRSAATSAA